MKEGHVLDQHICAKTVPLFNQLSQGNLYKITAITRHKTVKENELIFEPFNQNELIILASGSVKIYQLNKSGKEQLLRVMQPGDFEGEKILYGIENQNLYATALKESAICTLNKSEFQKLLYMYPDISQRLLSDFAYKLEMLEKQVELFNAESVESKIATYLIDLSFVQQSEVVTIPFKFKELATYLGTTPETISRKLRKLEQEALIKRQHLKIRLLDKQALENIL